MIIHHLFTSALHNFSISKFWSPWRINSTSLLIETTNVDQTSTSYNRTLTLQFKTDRQTSSLFHPTLIFAIRSISKSFKQKKKKSAGPFRGTPSRKIPRILHGRKKTRFVKIDTPSIRVPLRVLASCFASREMEYAFPRRCISNTSVPCPIYRRKRMGNGRKEEKGGGPKDRYLSISLTIDSSNCCFFLGLKQGFWGFQVREKMLWDVYISGANHILLRHVFSSRRIVGIVLIDVKVINYWITYKTKLFSPRKKA